MSSLLALGDHPVEDEDVGGANLGEQTFEAILSSFYSEADNS